MWWGGRARGRQAREGLRDQERFDETFLGIWLGSLAAGGVGVAVPDIWRRPGCVGCVGCPG